MSRVATKRVPISTSKAASALATIAAGGSIEVRGKIEDGQLVLAKPIALPDGTKVRLTIVPAEAVRQAKPPKAKMLRHLTQEQLSEFAKRHPPPQKWWDSTDNPFEP